MAGGIVWIPLLETIKLYKLHGIRTINIHRGMYHTTFTLSVAIYFRSSRERYTISLMSYIQIKNINNW